MAMRVIASIRWRHKGHSGKPQRRAIGAEDCAMIRVAVSARAYRAIKASLPEGSVVLKPERDGRGRYLLSLDESTINGLNVQRRVGESLSDVVIRLARQGRLPT
jgi:hypothetical protein